MSSPLEDRGGALHTHTGWLLRSAGQIPLEERNGGMRGEEGGGWKRGVDERRRGEEGGQG